MSNCIPNKMHSQASGLDLLTELSAAHPAQRDLCSSKVTESTIARAGSPLVVTLAPPTGRAQTWPLSVETGKLHESFHSVTPRGWSLQHKRARSYARQTN